MKEIHECPKHGKILFHLKTVKATGQIKRSCSRCSVEYLKAHRRKRKEKLVGIAGGKCIRCGYDKCVAALQFHHRKPKEKSFHISTTIRKMEVVLEEMKKCDLLCANCHFEIEFMAQSSIG